jgi:hypothetical protein
MICKANFVPTVKEIMPRQATVLIQVPVKIFLRLTSGGPGRWPGQSGEELGSTERFLHSLVEQQAAEVGRSSSGVLYNTDH